MVHPKKILSLILCFAMLTVILPAAYAVPTPAFLGPADLEDYYGLPDPFTFLDGHKVETEDDWAARRAEIFDMIQYYLYGYVHIPTVTQVSRNGTAISYTLSNAPQVAVDPSLAPATVNVSVTFSFNAANGVGNRDKLPVMIGGSNSAGFASSGWPGNTNQAGGTQSYTGTYYTLYPYIQGSLAYDTGKLIAGGWEVGRLIDALLLAANDDDPSNDFPEIDPYGMIPTGFSQGGKRALLAAAIDERVAVGFPGHAGAWGNSSVRLINDAKKYPAGNSTSFSNYTAADGIAAANMFSGYTGLRSEQMNQQHGNSYNTWFTSRFQAWTRGDHRYPISDANPSNLAKFPIDQHFLVALMAPRPVVLTEGMDDYWNDPEGCAIIHAAAKRSTSSLAYRSFATS
jgi:endo-1,4-beta-xylanase